MVRSNARICRSVQRPLAIALAVLTLPAAAHATDLRGFSAFGGGFFGRVNTDNSDVGAIGFYDNDTVLKISDNRPNIANSVWTAQPIDVGHSFTASWTYVLPGDSGSFDRADGFTFTLQNDPRGPQAIAGQGHNLGYASPDGFAITPSVSAQTNLYTTRRNMINTNGSVSASNGAIINNIILNNGVPKRYTISYANGILRQTIVDTATSTSVANNNRVSTYQRVVDIAAITGNLVHLGFTASSGINGADQTLSHFRFASNIPAAPIAATGWNVDMVVEASAPVGDVRPFLTATVDNGTNLQNGALFGATFFERGFAGTSTGLPMSTTVTHANDPTHTYTLQPADAPNAILLDGSNPTARLTLSRPQTLSALSLLLASGNGTNAFDVVLNHDDGTTELLQGNAAPDWYRQGIVAVPAMQRLGDPATGALDPASTPNAIDPALYSLDLLPEVTDKLVTSIDFIWTAGPAHSGIFALSGVAGDPVGPTPVPGDYNNDGFVDAADYTVWADHFGQIGPGVPGDGNGDGVVDAADYTVWADNFGQGTPPTPPTPPAASVPEPAALALGLPVLALLRRRR